MIKGPGRELKEIILLPFGAELQSELIEHFKVPHFRLKFDARLQHKEEHLFWIFRWRL